MPERRPTNKGGRKPLSKAEREAGVAKFNDHEAMGHTLTVEHVVEGSYMYFVTKCRTCGEEFIANCMEH